MSFRRKYQTLRERERERERVGEETTCHQNKSLGLKGSNIFVFDVVSKFELKSGYDVYFRTNTFGKNMNLSYELI